MSSKRSTALDSLSNAHRRYTDEPSGANYREWMRASRRVCELFHHDTTDETANHLIELIVSLLPSERVEIFDALFAKFCQHCGEVQPKSGRRCQCSNDE